MHVVGRLIGELTGTGVGEPTLNERRLSLRSQFVDKEITSCQTGQRQKGHPVTKIFYKPVVQ